MESLSCTSRLTNSPPPDSPKRCSLSGVDLNRRWASPLESVHPTIFHVKSLIADILKQREVVMYCDLHGHSRKKNVFVYGCAPRAGTTSINEFNQCRLLPFIMSQIGKEQCNGSLDESEEGRKERKLSCHSKDRGLYTNISMADSHFKVSRSKRGTARCVVFRELGVSNSLTVEASFCGPGDNRNEKRRLREWKKRARIRAAEKERQRAALKAESQNRSLGSGEKQDADRDPDMAEGTHSITHDNV